MSEEIRPCPFCPDSAPTVRGVGVSSFSVECVECYCDGPRRDTEAEAIAAWNERPEEERLRDWQKRAVDSLERMETLLSWTVAARLESDGEGTEISIVRRLIEEAK